MVTVQFPAPEHAPLQPAKTEPAAGVADSVTNVPASYIAAQVKPQLIEGEAGIADATVPAPLPALTTLSWKVAGGAWVATPVPDTDTLCGDSAAFDASVSSATRELGAIGTKVTCRLQVAFGVTFTQSCEALKSCRLLATEETVRFALPEFVIA